MNIDDTKEIQIMIDKEIKEFSEKLSLFFMENFSEKFSNDVLGNKTNVLFWHITYTEEFKKRHDLERAKRLVAANGYKIIADSDSA